MIGNVGNEDFPERFPHCPRLDHKLPSFQDDSPKFLTVVTISCADKSQNELQARSARFENV